MPRSSYGNLSLAYRETYLHGKSPSSERASAPVGRLDYDCPIGWDQTGNNYMCTNPASPGAEEHAKSSCTDAKGKWLPPPSPPAGYCRNTPGHSEFEYACKEWDKTECLKARTSGNDNVCYWTQPQNNYTCQMPTGCGKISLKGACQQTSGCHWDDTRSPQCQSPRICPTTWSQVAAPGNGKSLPAGSGPGTFRRYGPNTNFTVSVKPGSGAEIINRHTCLSDYNVGWPHCWGGGCTSCASCGADVAFDGSGIEAEKTGGFSKPGGILDGEMTISWTDPNIYDSWGNPIRQSESGGGCVFSGQKHPCGWKKKKNNLSPLLPLPYKNSGTES